MNLYQGTKKVLEDRQKVIHEGKKFLNDFIYTRFRIEDFS